MLHIHRAERADRLVDGLASVVRQPLEDPFAAEVVAVPTRGVERWLIQSLANSLGTSPGRADGVCANVVFPFPGRLVSGAVAAASGIEPDRDPWPPARSVWPLVDVVDRHLGDPWLAALASHLGGQAPNPDEHRRSRRFTTVRHFADLFDRYGVHRPAMIQAWACDDDHDGDGRPLPEDVAWQAQLWRHLRDRIGTPSPAERLTDACARLRDDPGVLELPARLSLFGLTRLPASYLKILHGIAAGRDVHLFLLHPSPGLWQRIATGDPGTQPRPGPLVRTADTTESMPRNPLLATWGQDAREMQVILAAGAGTGEVVEQHHALDEPGATLLRRIQADIRVDRAPPGPPLPAAADTRPLLDPGDRSVQVHACHGRPRQVEALRDAILHLLAEDSTLEPRDIIVMCPDIDAFAPLIHATFGASQRVEDQSLVDDRHAPPPRSPTPAPAVTAADPTTAPAPALVAAPGTAPPIPPPARIPPAPAPYLPVRLADRSIRQTNPVLAVVSELLSLCAGRFTASQVLDFASREPVRRRFGFDDDDLARLEEWVATTGIRWGIDAAHRAPYKLEALAANTWRAGLDRLLLGVTMAEDDQRLVGGVLPLDDVDSGDIDLAGRVAEFVDRLHEAIDELSDPRPVAAWVEAIIAAADALTATGDRTEWQRAQLVGLLHDVLTEAGGARRTEAGGARRTEAGGARRTEAGGAGRTEAGGAGRTAAGPNLGLAEVQALLADRLRGQPTRANFRTGHLTMCTLVPMRSVPHRVVCLLGLDDGAFPRKTAPDGDDLVQRSPRVGDHDLRSEDRQLLLDALMAATDHLVITYTGRDERTNAVRPPAVPLGELLDTIDRTVRIGCTAGADHIDDTAGSHTTGHADHIDDTAGSHTTGRPDHIDDTAGSHTTGRANHTHGTHHEPVTAARRRIVTHHPLQPFDVRNFTAGELIPGRPWSFDPVVLEGARASSAPRLARPAFLDHPLPRVASDLIELDDLVRFVQHPVKAFLRQRLGVSVRDRDDEPGDALPVELDNLERWDLGQRLLEARLAGVDLATCRAAETARGLVPPGMLGSRLLDEILPVVDGIAAVANALAGEPASRSSVEVNVDLGGVFVVGTVPDVIGDLLRAVTYSRLAPKQRLAAWVRLLAVTAGRPERPFRSVAIGRGDGQQVRLATIGPLGADTEARGGTARRHLAGLVDLYQRGMLEPLPIYCKTSAAYATARHAGHNNAEPKARKAWVSAWDYPNEDRELEHQLVWGGVASFEDVLAAAPRPDERRDSCADDEPSRFGLLARRLYDGLLTFEKLTAR